MSEAGPRVEIQLESMYLKDASFESPATPAVFGESWQPDLQVDINTKTNRVDDTRHEVVLTVTIRAKRTSGKTAFVIEVQQAGVFRMEGLTEDQTRHTLGVLCPSTLFPYLREAVDSLAVKGGFPALRLMPVNFEAHFNQAEASRKQAAAQPSGDSDDVTTH